MSEERTRRHGRSGLPGVHEPDPRGHCARGRGKSGSLDYQALDARAFEVMNLAHRSVVAVPHDPAKPDRSEAAYRSAWARTYLKKADLITNPGHGVWSATDKGRGVGTIDAFALASEVAAKYPKAVVHGGGARDAASDGDEDEELTNADGDAAFVLDEELTAARVGEDLAKQIREVHERLAAEGATLLPEEAARCLGLFREKFGPDVLAGLDGEALLTKMHGRGTKDSLVYWLEFKDDDEFPARFGGIGGGSALKFGIYQSATETEQWMAGSPRQQRRLTLEEAIAIASERTATSSSRASGSSRVARRRLSLADLTCRCKSAWSKSLLTSPRHRGVTSITRCIFPICSRTSMASARSATTSSSFSRSRGRAIPERPCLRWRRSSNSG